MEALKCPSCSAPANIGRGQVVYRCTYCDATFKTGLEPPPPPPPPAVPAALDVAPAVTPNIVWVAMLAPVLVLLGGGALALSATPHAMSSYPSGLAWDGSSSFSCMTNENVSVSGVHADFLHGTAVSVKGNCHFTCTDCIIRAPVAIQAGENGDVTIVNGTVIGSEALVDATDNAHVNISGKVTTSGAVKQSGLARVSAPRPTGDTGPALPALPGSPKDPVVCRKARELRTAREPEAIVRAFEQQCLSQGGSL